MVCFAMRGDSVGCFGLKVFSPYVVNLHASDAGKSCASPRCRNYLGTVKRKSFVVRLSKP